MPFSHFLALEAPSQARRQNSAFSGRGPGGSEGVPKGGFWGAPFWDLGRLGCTCGWVGQRKLAMGEALHLEAQPSPRGCIRPFSNEWHHPLSIQ